MDILRSFKSMLDRRGIRYVQTDDSVQMMLCSGQHKWKCAVTATDNSFICIYNSYPWEVAPDKTDKLLLKMNEMNKGIAAGCFMISGGSAVYRYALHIGDPLLFTDIAAERFASAAAMTDRAWDDIYLTLFSAEV